MTSFIKVTMLTGQCGLVRVDSIRTVAAELDGTTGIKTMHPITGDTAIAIVKEPFRAIVGRIRRAGGRVGEELPPRPKKPVPINMPGGT